MEIEFEPCCFSSFAGISVPGDDRAVKEKVAIRFIQELTILFR